jgi:hypothetical protein
MSCFDKRQVSNYFISEVVETNKTCSIVEAGEFYHMDPKNGRTIESALER